MNKKSSPHKFLLLAGIALVLWLLIGCTAPAAVSTPILPTDAPTLPVASTPTIASPEGSHTGEFSDQEIATLNSLELVDDYPLYIMRYQGTYNQRRSLADRDRGVAGTNPPNPDSVVLPPEWACSLFAALGNKGDMLYGRNFDWEHSPALLLFTNPADGYASVSIVDIAYLGFEGTKASTLTDLPLIERRALLDAPFLPFDGLNEHGLAVGMAAVPPGQMDHDPAKETIGSLMAIRQMLDQAGNVDKAVAILQSYNIDMGGGPPIHYLIADSSGHSVLVEFYEGEMVVIPNEMPWHLATNFLQATAGESAAGECRRYDTIYQQLAGTEGQITALDAMDILSKVSQRGTQWSAVYGMSTGDINIVMGQKYDNAYTFHLHLVGE